MTYDKVLEVLGAVDLDTFSKLFRYVAEGNVIGCMEILEELVVRGRELSQVVIDFTWYLRNLLLMKTSEHAQDMIDVSTEHFAIMQEEKDMVDVSTYLRYIRVLSELSNQLRYATQKRVLIEIAWIKLCRPSMEQDYDSILDRLRVIEKQLEQGVPVSSVQNAENPRQSGDAVKKIEEVPMEVLEKAVPEDLKQVAKYWDRICGMVPGSMYAVLREAVPTVGEGNSLLILISDPTAKGLVDKEERIQEIKNAIQSLISKEVEVQIRLTQEQTGQGDPILDLTRLTKMAIEFED